MKIRLAKICPLLPFALILALLLSSCEKKRAPKSAQVEAAEQTAQTEQITESEQTAENRAAVDELRATFAAAKPLVENETDRLVLTAAMNNLVMLSETCPLESSVYGAKYESKDTHGFSSLRARFDKGMYKGACGHFVKAAFYLRGEGGRIVFYLTEDESDLCIDIGGGGERGANYKKQGGDELRDGNPDRFYEFNTKTGEAHFSDFYWD